MKYGVWFSHPDIGNDPIVIRDFVQAVDGAGFDRLYAAEHVVGGHPDRAAGTVVHTNAVPYHEPFVLFGFMAAVTARIELMTAVLVLPQRQAALVAKQAAEVDLLSGGRLRLGVGIGWNPVEYQALGEEFHNRGARLEEQIAVLRALWAAPVVTFRGRWHQIEAAGINPLPVQRPIPIWLGGSADAAIERAGRIGDGWMPQRPPDDQSRRQVELLRGAASAAGRPAGAVGVEARLSIGTTPEAEWARFVEGWRALGATHLSVNTMGAGLAAPHDHVEALRRVKDALGV